MFSILQSSCHVTKSALFWMFPEADVSGEKRPDDPGLLPARLSQQQPTTGLFSIALPVAPVPLGNAPNITTLIPEGRLRLHQQHEWRRRGREVRINHHTRLTDCTLPTYTHTGSEWQVKYSYGEIKKNYVLYTRHRVCPTPVYLCWYYTKLFESHRSPEYILRGG